LPILTLFCGFLAKKYAAAGIWRIKMARSRCIYQ